jgi:hypothetical protein
MQYDKKLGFKEFLTLMKYSNFLIFTLSILTSLSSQAAPANDSSVVKDTAITTYIYAQMAADLRLTTKTLNVTTTHGVVVLNGIVSSDQEAKAIAKLAAGTKGVHLVDARRIVIAPVANQLFGRRSAKNQPTVEEVTPLIATVDPILTKSLPAAAKVVPPQAKVKVRKFKSLTHHHLLHPRMGHRHKALVVKKIARHHRLALKAQHKLKTAKLAMKKPKVSAPKRIAAVKVQHPVLAQNERHTGNVTQMTNDYLKSALMATKVIPES